MDRDKWMWIGIAIVAIFILGIFTQKNYNLFSSYPADCKFITNVDPYTSRYTSYGNSANWIAIDYNNDGTKEAFGYTTSSSSSARLSSCGRDSGSTLLVQDFNSYGDDIYYYYTGGTDRVYVCSPDGYNARGFIKGANEASNAVLTCGTCTPSNACASSTCIGSTCTDACGNSYQGTKTCTTACTSGQKECLTSTSYRQCSNGVWSGSLSCASGQTCSQGVCSTTPPTCPTFNDVINYASQWVGC